MSLVLLGPFVLLLVICVHSSNLFIMFHPNSPPKLWLTCIWLVVLLAHLLSAEWTADLDSCTNFPCDPFSQPVLLDHMSWRQTRRSTSSGRLQKTCSQGERHHFNGGGVTQASETWGWVVTCIMTQRLQDHWFYHNAPYFAWTKDLLNFIDLYHVFKVRFETRFPSGYRVFASEMKWWSFKPLKAAAGMVACPSIS